MASPPCLFHEVRRCFGFSIYRDLSERGKRRNTRRIRMHDRDLISPTPYHRIDGPDLIWSRWSGGWVGGVVCRVSCVVWWCVQADQPIRIYASRWEFKISDAPGLLTYLRTLREEPHRLRIKCARTGACKMEKTRGSTGQPVVAGGKAAVTSPGRPPRPSSPGSQSKIRTSQ